jgi:hypothetical protein
MFTSRFNFESFYNGLSRRHPVNDMYDGYWEKFPGGKFQFKMETLSLVKKAVAERNSTELSYVLAIVFRDGVDEDYTEILTDLLDEKWHYLEEDIVSILEQLRDPKSTDKIFEVAKNIPPDDDMRALAKKCILALRAIDTQESMEKLKLLKDSKDPIISQAASFHLGKMMERKESGPQINI